MRREQERADRGRERIAHLRAVVIPLEHDPEELPAPSERIQARHDVFEHLPEIARLGRRDRANELGVARRIVHRKHIANMSSNSDM